ncbi:hypothetical protein ACIBAH_34910 [Streptomyces sp. NPDC051445]|uniref:hypothetical protein n=1 Tax=Streptomyces sp. NPDC051445 TaxID=3365653 RepID=UPI0037B6ACBF
MLSATDPVEVWRTSARTTNAYTSKPDWSQAVKVWSGFGDVQPDKAYESYSPDRDVSQERKAVFLPLEADVTEEDRIFIDGAWYEVDGAPRRHTKTSRRHTYLVVWRSLR